MHRASFTIAGGAPRLHRVLRSGDTRTDLPWIFTIAGWNNNAVMSRRTCWTSTRWTSASVWPNGESSSNRGRISDIEIDWICESPICSSDILGSTYEVISVCDLYVDVQGARISIARDISKRFNIGLSCTVCTRMYFNVMEIMSRRHSSPPPLSLSLSLSRKFGANV